MLAEWRILYQGCSDTPIVTATVRLRGDLDIAVRSLLTEHLSPLAARRLDGLEYDLTAVTYMDAAAAGILIQLGRSALPPGKQPVIVGASAQIRRLLRLSGLDADCVLSAKRYARRASEVSEHAAAAVIAPRPSA